MSFRAGFFFACPSSCPRFANGEFVVNLYGDGYPVFNYYVDIPVLAGEDTAVNFDLKNHAAVIAR